MNNFHPGLVCFAFDEARQPKELVAPRTVSRTSIVLRLLAVDLCSVVAGKHPSLCLLHC